MGVFRYSGVDNQGSRVHGKIEAVTRPHALDLLESQGLTLFLLMSGEKSFFETMVSERGNQKLLSTKERAEFYSNLNAFLKAGVSLENALSLNASLSSKLILINFILDIRRSIREGLLLSEALRKSKRPFPLFEIAQITVAERTGKIDETLNNLACTLEKVSKFRKKIANSLIYPIFLVLGAMLALSIVVFMVIPRFKPFFEGMEENLPFLTKTVFFIGDIITNYWLVIFLLVLFFLGALFLLLKNEKMKEYIINRLDLTQRFKGFFFKPDYIRLSQSWGLSINNNLPADEGLVLALHGVKSNFLKKICAPWVSKIREGEKISSILKNERIFPPVFYYLIFVGENTGRIGDMLEEISEVLETDYNNQLERFTSLLIPGFTLFAGVFIGLLIISILLGMFAVNEFVL